MDSKNISQKVGNYCKNFRCDVMGITLTEFCKKWDLNIKNVSAFEHGKANNIAYLYFYMKECNDKELETFGKGLFRIV